MGGWGVLFARGRGCDGEDGFDREAHVLDSLGVPYEEIPLDEVVHERPEDALRHLPRARGRAWLYRGWMLAEEDYAVLDEAIRDRGDHLVVGPAAYAAAAYLPEWAPLLGHRTPASVWTESDDPDEAWEEAQLLGPPPWILKDHMKSARQRWNTACFVPAGADREAFRALCEGLLDFHGDRFQRGIVVRRFVELAPLPWRAEGHPVFDEHRIVFWNGRPVARAPYHDVDDAIPLRRVPFPELGELIDSPFFVADVARLRGGGMVVIELNDGGTSTLPAQLDPWELYEAIADDPP